MQNFELNKDLPAEFTYTLGQLRKENSLTVVCLYLAQTETLMLEPICFNFWYLT